MSYYIGFRFGWLRLGRRMLLWSDTRLYPYMRGRKFGVWSVRLK